MTRCGASEILCLAAKNAAGAEVPHPALKNSAGLSRQGEAVVAADTD